MGKYDLLDSLVGLFERVKYQLLDTCQICFMIFEGYRGGYFLKGLNAGGHKKGLHGRVFK